MDERTRSQMIQQYSNAEAKIASLPVTSDEQIMQAAYQGVLRALLVSVAADMPSDQLPEEAFNERLKVLSGIARAVDGFIQNARKRPLTPEQQRAVDEIESLNAVINSLREQNSRMEDEIRKKTAEINVRRKKLEEPTKKREELEQEIEDLRNRANEVTPDILGKLEAQRDDLDNKLREAQNQHDNLSAEVRIGKESLENQEKSNRELQAEIDAQPTELKQLQQDYEALQHRLEDTQNALVRCAEDKQAELRQQIEEQEPVAEALKRDYEAISQQAEKIRSLSEELHQKKDRELIALWPQVLNVLQELKGKVGEMEEELAQTEKNAEDFYSHVRECDQKLGKLRQWYHAEKTPLDAFIAKVGNANDYENRSLRETWDVSRNQEVRDKMNQAEEILTWLEDLLRDASIAAENDEKRMRRRADTDEKSADAESNQRG